MVIDGHNDLVLRRWRGEPSSHMDLEAARVAGFAGGFFALFVPSPHPHGMPEIPYVMPLADPIPHEEAARIADRALRDVVRVAGPARAVGRRLS